MKFSFSYAIELLTFIFFSCCQRRTRLPVTDRDSPPYASLLPFLRHTLIFSFPYQTYPTQDKGRHFFDKVPATPWHNSVANTISEPPHIIQAIDIALPLIHPKKKRINTSAVSSLRPAPTRSHHQTVTVPLCTVSMHQP